MIRSLKRALVAWAAISFAVVAYDLLLGGFYVTLLGVRISSSDALKPFRNGVAALAVAMWIDARERGRDLWWDRLERWAAPLAAATAMVFVATAIHFGIFAAGDSDSYGYVSQANLWASGRLIVSERLAPIGRELGIVTAPLAYHAALVPGAIVPSYPPGLPMMMAVASTLAGKSAVYFVVPMLAGVAVWMTFVLGRRIADSRTAFMAAVLFACSPIFLFQSLQAMSDVPVAAWFLVAWALVVADAGWSVLAAGLAASAAVLTRPNLAPLAALLACVAARKRPHITRFALFSAGVLPGIAAVAAINWRLYGSPLKSGYGSFSELYEWANAGSNLQRYFTWLIQLHSPAVLAGVAAPFVIRRHITWWMLAFCAAVLLSYVFWGVFNNWTFLRFLLPAIPLLLILGAALFVSVVSRAQTLRSALFVAACTSVVTWSLYTVHDLDVLAIGSSERRYQSVGRFLGGALPPNAVVISVIESGSVRLYSDRDTLRWDEIPPAQLDRVLETLRARGYAPYILLEDWEEPMFRERFAPFAFAGRVDWPAAIEYYGPITVRVYDPADRARYLAGEHILPKIVPPG